ncbi:ABC transporter ATP-binding protein [Nostoc sp. TCL26-01]|uniref:ABC transporter ATP-binding protein n=1 Tax=Nostoc sp. TCL26-01 TaxID=2576904 RepID=UPI0015BB9348|nr:ABC transporter ATP-binding protein [Nostoc sp. TCL26-01]QLE54420.1 ABC transporter ATP-binding protein [Nostoc sp. TCL26-01]
MKALEVQNICKHYHHHQKVITAVRDVSLTINTGEVLAFLGPNGAGKTTAIKIMAGLICPDEGWVEIGGINPHKNARALKGVGTVLEGNRNLYWRLTPEENLEYFGILKGLSRSRVNKRQKELLARFGLTHKRNTPVQALSRGMQQKLAIAVAMIHEPLLLLLDEPTLGLDLEAAEVVKALVKEIASEGHAILLTTHQIEVAEELSHRVAIINQGEIITEQPTQELIKQFSGLNYSVEFDGKLDQVQIQALEKIAATVEEERFIYLQKPENIYQLLQVLSPLPLVKVQRDQADLIRVFKKLVQLGDR